MKQLKFQTSWAILQHVNCSKSIQRSGITCNRVYSNIATLSTLFNLTSGFNSALLVLLFFAIPLWQVIWHLSIVLSCHLRWNGVGRHPGNRPICCRCRGQPLHMIWECAEVWHGWPRRHSFHRCRTQHGLSILLHLLVCHNTEVLNTFRHTLTQRKRSWTPWKLQLSPSRSCEPKLPRSFAYTCSVCNTFLHAWQVLESCKMKGDSEISAKAAWGSAAQFPGTLGSILCIPLRKNNTSTKNLTNRETKQCCCGDSWPKDAWPKDT